MEKICEFDVYIAVDYKGTGFILSYPLARNDNNDIVVHPECVKFGLDIMWDGPFCEDNNFNNVPEVVGVYKCKTEFWFDQGYFEGHLADGENDWEFNITGSVEVASIPNPIHFNVENEIGGGSN